MIAVPAEEGVSADYKKYLEKEKIVRYFSGKTEFLYRGYLDGVDMAMMVHASTETDSMDCPVGTNGNIHKKATFLGKSAHAGASPHLGKNALYAATTALSAANALRETFREKDYIRFHPIISQGGTVVNAIPDTVVCDGMLRGAEMNAIQSVSRQINLAFAGCAAAMGCGLILKDHFGTAPRYNDHNMRQSFWEVASEFFPPEGMNFNKSWETGCSDMGNISAVMPAVHPFIGGVAGGEHSDDYYVSDAEKACVTGGKIIVGVIIKMLENDGAFAQKVLAEKKVPFATKEDFFAAIDAFNQEINAVVYEKDGTVILKMKAEK